MMQQANPEELPESSKDPSRLDIIGGIAATEGFSNLINIDKVLNEIDDSIVFVDKSFKDLVATMGRGEDYASGFGKVLEATAKDIILAGGKREDAIKIQLETISVMGRASMLSQKQATDLFNASKVTGVASKDLSTAFLDSGRNLSNISKEMLAVREVAQSLGANAKQVSSLVVSNLDKLNRFSFQGGVEGLARMAANSQTLRIGMESTLDLADELIDPERAIEMASEFQRMGVASEALTNPLRLMDMAQNDVEGLQKEIGDALSEFVTIGEDGTKTISTQGRRIMKQLAASGVMTRGELEKLAIGTREIQDKMSKISFSGLNLDEDTQKLIANVAQLGEGGVYEIQTKNKDGDIVTKSIQQFVQDLGGDQEKIREALLSQEEKTGDASKDMGAIAQGQLDVLTKIKQSNDALLAAIGFTVSAGKTGPELLKISEELNKIINKPLFDQVGSESNIGKGLDTTADEIKKALEEFKSGKLDQAGLMKLIQDVGGAGGKLAGQFGEAGLTVVKDYAKQFGIGEEAVDNFIEGIKEGLPEAKQQGVDLLYAVLDGMNKVLEEAGIKVPDNLKKEKEEEKKTGGTGGGTTPLPVPDNKKGGTGGGTTPLPTPQQGKGGDEGLLFLEDLQTLDLQQLTSQLIQPLEKLDVGTSEVGTLNVQNLVIGGGLEKIITQNESEGFTPQTPEPTPTIQPTNTETTTTEEIGLLNELKVDTVNVQNLVIGSGLEKTITPKEGEPLINQEQVESVVKPTVTPTLVQPSINISQPIPQEELPSIPETTEELPSLKKVVEEPKEDKKGFFEKVNNFVQELKTEPVKENLNLNEVLKPVPTTEPSEITKTFETSLDNISKLKMPELGIFKKEEQKPSDLVKGFEDSAKKMADLKIGGLEEKPKIELGKPEGKTEEGLFDKKPSILGKFISKKQSETEEEPKEEKKGKFSKIKDAFVKSFIEPENTQEEYETIVPKYGEEPTQIEPIAPVTEEPTSIGRTIDELEPTTTETSVKPELTEEVKETEPITELKIDTSEVGTLNVQNLNIGTALDGIVNALGVIPQNQTQLTTLEGLDLEAAVAKTTPTETASITEEGLPTIEEGLPEVDTTLKKTIGGFAKTEPSFSEMEYGSKAPSQYESFKKVLEQSYGGEIIGTGAEAFVLTPEMKAQAKKDSEFIGPENPIDLSEELESKVEIPTKKIELGGPKKLMGLSEKFNPEIGSTKPTGLVEELKVKTPESPLEGETAIRSSLAFKSGNLKELEEKFPEASKKIRKEAAFSKVPGEKFELPELTKEEEEIMMEGNILTKPYDKLEEKYYDMKATQGRREAEKFEKEKLAGGGTLSKEDEETLQSMRKRATEYANKSYEIEEGEVESFDTKIETKGLIEDKGLAPIKPTLASLPIPEKEEKQPLGERIKEGIGGLKEKLKGKQEEEKPIAAVPETQEEYVVKDKEGKELARSIDRETAEKKAGTSEGITVSKETRAITPSAPEIPAVGVEKAAAEVKEPKTLRERIEGGADKLSSGIEKFAGKIGEKFEGSKIKSKIDEARSKIKPQEEESKIEPIKPETVPTLSEEDKKFQEERQRKMEEESKIISSVQTDAYGKPVTLGGEEKSGYLKMLEENDAEADKFLTSKSGRPVNLDNDKTEKIELKGIEGFGKKEKPSPFGLDMKMFEQKLPEAPKASLEKTKTDKIDVKAIEDSAPKVEDTRSALEKVSLTASEDEGFEGGLIEPAEIFPTEDEVRQNKEKEETKARSFAYLEELRLREQTPTVPETPAKGIEKIAQLGQKFEGKIGGLKGKLFGKKEEEESSLAYYEPEISTEEPYMSESIKEAGTEDYGTLDEDAESEYTPTTVGAIEEVAPSIPEPTVYPFAQLQEFMGQGAGAGQTASQSENTENINVNVKLEIVGNSEFAKLIDPRQFQQKIESIMTTSIGKTQIAQRFNSATSTEVASMGLNDTNRRRG